MNLVSGVVVGGWWYMYGHDIPLLYECYCYTRQEPSLTGLDRPIDQHMTSNYTPDMLSCYPRYWNQELESCRWRIGSRMMMQIWICYPIVYEYYMMYGPCLIGVDHPQTNAWPQTTPQICSAVTLNVGTKSFLNHGPHQWCSDPRMMTSYW